MQLYFMKATYTNNVYKISEFFLSGDYKLDANKMLDINFRPDDGLSQFITSNITLPDTTEIRDHTHVIVPSHDKIYKIISTDYLNNGQYQITVDEDPFIGQYLNFEDKDMFLYRSNDPNNFRGIHDIADQTFEEEVLFSNIKTISPDILTGRWALLFFQFDPSDTVLALKFDNTVYGQHLYETDITSLRLNYPEVQTDDPEKYDYYNRTCYTTSTGQIYQCVYVNGASPGQLKWVFFHGTTTSTHYFDVGTVLQPAKINQTDVFTVCIALPFESCLYSNLWSKYYLSYNQFIGPVDTSLIDIKIVSDLHIPVSSVSEYYVSSTLEFRKVLSYKGQSMLDAQTYNNATLTTPTNHRVLSFLQFETDFDLSLGVSTGGSVYEYEPFVRYDLYVYGQQIKVPRYLSNDIHMLIALNSGVVNYLIYYQEKRNVIASGSFTHSIKYQIDQLDAFYSQNPTYKEQFYLKMATDSFKTVAGGAIGGAMVGGPVGALAGAGAGIVGAGVDAGIGMMNLHLQEKGLRMKPDQMFGENSEVSLQVLNIFGVYWVKRVPENADQMQKEYWLRGFPTTKYMAIEDLSYQITPPVLVNCKVVFGELKFVVRNEFTTAFINEKLKQGVILIQ